MPHKITLTGIPVSNLRKGKNNTYSFDMEEKGSPNAPKGLSISSTITYTVFVTKKTIDKANINIGNFQNTKLLIQGEPTLDLPLDECPGEIGVICFQISEIEQREKEEKEETTPIEKEVKQTKNIEQSKPKEEVIKIETINDSPDFSKYDHIPLNAISIPKKIDVPSSKRYTKEIEYAQNTKEISKAIEVTYNKGKLLVTNNGHVYLLAAKEIGLEKVPVDVVISKKFMPDDTDEFILLDKLNIPDEFISNPANPTKIKTAGEYFRKMGMIDKPIAVEKETFTLKDGYARYLYLKENDILYIPIRWI